MTIGGWKWCDFSPPLVGNATNSRHAPSAARNSSRCLRKATATAPPSIQAPPPDRVRGLDASQESWFLVVTSQCYSSFSLSRGLAYYTVDGNVKMRKVTLSEERIACADKRWYLMISVIISIYFQCENLTQLEPAPDDKNSPFHLEPRSSTWSQSI